MSLYKIPKKQLLSFIDNSDLYRIVEEVLIKTQEAETNSEKNFFKNSIDPFSAVFESMKNKITIESWIDREKYRQIQKTMQNALGDFHQNMLGCFYNWSDMRIGQVFDLLNKKKKIIAEVKNKYNTTKGNHKVSIYDDLEVSLKKYKGFTAYYVEIIPKGKKVYNKEFTPSDNKTKTSRKKNPKIRVIDGKSFYDLASGHKDSLKMLYDVLPLVIGGILGADSNDIIKDKFFTELFTKTYTL